MKIMKGTLTHCKQCSVILIHQNIKSYMIFAYGIKREKMAFYRCNLNNISRGNGQSAVASSAYRAGTKLHDDRIGKDFDYSKKASVEFSNIYMPDNENSIDRSSLWNYVESYEKRKDARLAREFQVGLPRELSQEQRQSAINNFVKENFTSDGYIADVNIHNPYSRNDGEEQPHAHIMVTERKYENGDFSSKKDRHIQSKEYLENIRSSWEKSLNSEFEKAGLSERVSSKSLVEQREKAFSDGDYEKAIDLTREPINDIKSKSHLKAVKLENENRINEIREAYNSALDDNQRYQTLREKIDNFDDNISKSRSFAFGNSRYNTMQSFNRAYERYEKQQDRNLADKDQYKNKFENVGFFDKDGRKNEERKEEYRERSNQWLKDKSFDLHSEKNAQGTRESLDKELFVEDKKINAQEGIEKRTEYLSKDRNKVAYEEVKALNKAGIDRESAGNIYEYKKSVNELKASQDMIHHKQEVLGHYDSFLNKNEMQQQELDYKKNKLDGSINNSLSGAYQNSDEAREAIDAHIAEYGEVATLNKMKDKPEDFGKLQGGFFDKSSRKEAMSNIDRAYSQYVARDALENRKDELQQQQDQYKQQFNERYGSNHQLESEIKEMEKDEQKQQADVRASYNKLSEDERSLLNDDEHQKLYTPEEKKNIDDWEKWREAELSKHDIQQEQVKDKGHSQEESQESDDFEAWKKKELGKQDGQKQSLDLHDKQQEKNIAEQEQKRELTTGQEMEKAEKDAEEKKTTEQKAIEERAAIEKHQYEAEHGRVLVPDGYWENVAMGKLYKEEAEADQFKNKEDNQQNITQEQDGQEPNKGQDDFEQWKQSEIAKHEEQKSTPENTQEQAPDNSQGMDRE